MLFQKTLVAYAHMRKLMGRFNEIDLADRDAKEKMRSGPVLDDIGFNKLWDAVPAEPERALKEQDAVAD
jgi:hypothetical protein